MNFKFDLLEMENVGTIELGDKARISDPGYSMDTWCAGTLEDVMPGVYNCFMQKVDTGDWGVRVASIEVKHRDYTYIEPNEIQDIYVGVDSGQAGIYDLDYFAENNKNESWYWRVCDNTYVEDEFAASALDNKCLVSSSGDGDGSYACLVGRSEDGKIVAIKIDYYYGHDDEDYEE